MSQGCLTLELGIPMSYLHLLQELGYLEDKLHQISQNCRDIIDFVLQNEKYDFLLHPKKAITAEKAKPNSSSVEISSKVPTDAPIVPSGWNVLPDPLLGEILCHLDHKSLKALYYTCKYFRNLVTTKITDPNR